MRYNGPEFSKNRKNQILKKLVNSHTNISECRFIQFKVLHKVYSFQGLGLSHLDI